MKHNLKVTIILVLLFIASQVIGLIITDKYLQPELKLPFGIQRPDTTPQETFIEIALAIAITTAVALIIVRFKKVKVWRAWFFLSILFTLTISFKAFFSDIIALLLALIMSMLKMLKKSMMISNITELFIYAALPALFVPLLNLFWMSIFLVVISIYDVIAVWKTRHMVSLAEFQKSTHFAGFHIRYAKKREAILGGGDIAIPMLYAGVVLKTLGVTAASIVVGACALTLLLLFLLGKKNTYYPAMPYISAGCFIGTLISLLFI